MAQESISKRIAIIGGGPAGCICAKFLSDEGLDVAVFDKDKPLKTLLPTGGGKCNLAHAEYDFRELAKYYPRGEKFLYSIFSLFSTSDTLEFFKSIGVETYTREDNRIFPASNSSADVRDKFLNSIRKAEFLQETVTSIEKLDNGYKIKTNKSSYFFDTVVVATGGMLKNNILNGLDIRITEPTQSLVGYKTQKDFSKLAGVSIKNVKYKNLTGDILFTHKGISGPLIYTISSYNARQEFPYTINLKISEIESPQELLDKNAHKEIKNLIGQFVPKSFAISILEDLNISPDTHCHKINGETRDKIFNRLNNFEITVTGKVADSEIVTCGGVDLNEINPKTLEAKSYPHLYFCGEVLDIDGLCGGFNLQNCWSTGYIAAQSIINRLT